MTKAKPIPQELLDKLVYDETSPTCLRWKERHRAAIPEDRRAGSFRKDGYVQIGLQQDGWRFMGKGHRVVWALHHADPGELEVDHIDGNPSNNRLDNLQAIPHQKNQTRMDRGRGYHRARSGKWTAQIQVAGERKHIGTFDTEEEARAAYLSAKAVATEGIQ